MRFNEKISTHLWGSALLLSYVATAVFLSWFLYLMWGSRTVTTTTVTTTLTRTTTIVGEAQTVVLGGTYRQLLIPYIIMTLLCVFSIFMLRKGRRYPKLVGIAVIACGVIVFLFTSGGFYYMLIRPEGVLLSVAGLLCVVCSPENGGRDIAK